ncbi:hypothetical protein [Marinobacter sp. F3R11]|uniref:hypothetical protein n=1 Tax=Marinobacter sp. F3R11 TaxID=2267231 RepID=UPI000DE94E32|nr:hypothetical protein [Marinobacter sp. F3R11]RBW48596.1 hypothetical protein DS878_10500 [Marinobacter sp. F3R11]
MTAIKRIPFVLALALTIGGCSSNKNIQFEGEDLEKPAYDGTLARVSIFGISDGHGATDDETLDKLQAIAKEKFQANKNLFSGSGNQLYTLKINSSVAESGIECTRTKLSYTTEGTLTTNYILATLERHPRTLFDVDIETKGHHETSVMSDIENIVNCGTQTAIATDAISRSIRIFDLLVKQANGMDVTHDLEKVKSDEDIEGSAIVMRVFSGALYAVVVPIGVTVETIAETDWSDTISAAAKAASNLPAASYDPLAINNSTPAYTMSPPSPTPTPAIQTEPTQQQSPSSVRATQSNPQTQPAPKATKPAPKTVTTEIQTSGTTNMHFPYDQALNLATTNADTLARQQCRENHRGKITTLSDPNMVRKECTANRNDEYRCVVQITHTCEYTQ